MKKEFFKYDVVVIGGGIAGVAASLSARRAGKKVCLIESTFLLGGLATSGLVTFYLPLCDGQGKQIHHGISEELLMLSLSKGYEGDYPDAWLHNGSLEEKKKHRFMVRFNANQYALMLEELLLKEGVDILYGTTVYDVEFANKEIKKVFATSRAQKLEIVAGSYVDTTGDATLFDLCGSKTELSSHGNVLSNWYYEVINGEYKLNQLGSCDYVYSDGGSYKSFVGLEAMDLTKANINSHKEILKHFYSHGDGSVSHNIATVATIPAVRITRKIKGLFELDKADTDKFYEESVGTFTSWLHRCLNYELPYKSLISSDIVNAYAAGRCISVKNDDMWDITRSIPVCSTTGEAAGLLAALFTDNTKINVKEVQKILDKRGTTYHLNQIK